MGEFMRCDLHSAEGGGKERYLQLPDERSLMLSLFPLT